MDTAYLYQYTIGGLVFLFGAIVAARQGYLGLSGRPLKNLLMLVAVFGLFAGLQGYLQHAPMREATPLPYYGGVETEGIRGTTLDYAIMVAYFVCILAAKDSRSPVALRRTSSE